MTQQINLYAREEEQRRGPLVVTAIGLVAFLLLLIGYGQVMRERTKNLETRERSATQNLQNEKAALQTMKEALAARTDPAKLAAEIAALKSRATEAQDIVDRVARGELGTLEGFSGHFTTLARIGEPGVWLTAVKVQNAGRIVEIEGRSLQAESVLRYATEVNRQVASYGASVTAVEMTPIANAQTRATAVSFKLF
jgi:Tfp pilus assembly protein PilN